MKAEVAIAILSVIMAFLGIGLTLVTGYLAFLALTLEKRLRAALQSDATEQNRLLRDLISARLLLVDLTVEILCAARRPGDATGIPGRELYFLEHVGRLATDDPAEIGKALGALEAGGRDVLHLLPYVERIRAKSNWPAESVRQFEKLLRQVREDARAKHAVPATSTTSAG